MDQILNIEIDGEVAVAEVLARRLVEDVNITHLGVELFALLDVQNRRQVVLDLRMVEYIEQCVVWQVDHV